ncbi:MAG: hypothetical protein EWV82_18290 [Microcystis aeruginosa Ma_AC_P_19900807_S299]|nr:MAG: hypothetical protein EWV82_18290 [Microcystis aeruginosa Ma_AC_P_19900807_S299]
MSSIISKIISFLAIISNLNSIVYLLVLNCLRLKSLPIWISATFSSSHFQRILFLVNYLHNKSRRTTLVSRSTDR